MADSVGVGGFLSGTGTEIINLGMTLITRVQIIPEGNSSRKPSIGFIAGGNQKAISDQNAPSVNGVAIQVKDNSGTVVFEATYVSQTSTTLTFNKTINTVGTLPCLFYFGK